MSGVAPGRGAHTHRDGWGVHAHRALRAAGVRQVAYVPDAGLSALLDLCAADETMLTVLLAHEQEGLRWPPAPGSAASARRC